MVSAIYASLSALLIVWLSLNVIKERRANKISLGDGDCEALRIAMAAQANAIEYIPITLILLFAIEYNQASTLLIHVFGVALVVGRGIHAFAIINENLKYRVLGMQITIFTMIGLAISNIFYLPFHQVFSI
jgi:uncharacterized membrane protein YecN with MAPEG domain